MYDLTEKTSDPTGDYLLANPPSAFHHTHQLHTATQYKHEKSNELSRCTIFVNALLQLSLLGRLRALPC
uniref:Uncharacterized protein n=1 Tax=Haemonchus contortus TaxID=6289 RepID=W6NGL1_HAECO